MRVSVLVPTLNSEATITACLQSLAGQSYPDLELIVIDGFSKDQTVALAEKFATRVIRAGGERSAQLNAGARVATGEFLYRVDSDFVVDQFLIEEAVEAANSQGLDAVLIHNHSDPSHGFWARAREFEREMYRGDFTNVAARFWRTDVFWRIGGFNENMLGWEDYELHSRLVSGGFKIGWINASENHLGEPRSIRDVASKHFYYGRQAVPFLRSQGAQGVALLSPARPAFFRNWRRFVRHPARASEFFVYAFVKYSSGLAGLLVGVLDRILGR